jgi:hypothetical protein
MIASTELLLLGWNKVCLQTAVSVCIYQADPVAQIEHDKIDDSDRNYLLQP